MRTISEVYENYAIPNGLQMHMLRVGAIAEQVLSAWNGPHVDSKRLIRVLLLHDMGNIVKIPEEPGEDIRLTKMRERFTAMYGTDDHMVSREIGREVGLTEDEILLMDGKIFVRNDETLRSDDYGRKIGAYADQRAAPTGVQPLLARLREAQERYSDKPGSSMNNPRTEMLIECAVKIEDQVMEYCGLAPSDITDASIASFIEELRHFEI